MNTAALAFYCGIINITTAVLDKKEIIMELITKYGGIGTGTVCATCSDDIVRQTANIYHNLTTI